MIDIPTPNVVFYRAMLAQSAVMPQ